MNKNPFIYFILILLSLPASQCIAQQELNPEQIYEKVDDAVVIVLSYDTNGEVRNQGSGVVVSEDSYVLTNYHLMKNSSAVKIMHKNLLIENVEIIGGDEGMDLLVLKIPSGKFSILAIPESNDVKIGQRVYAIGSPLGYENTISEGIVSGFRSYEEGLNLLQITASISHGSSGGAVVNSKGELIGISTYTVTEGQNINFAIPIQDLLMTEIKPYSELNNLSTRTEIEEKENNEEKHYPDKKNFVYDPKAMEFFNEGKELIKRAYSQENKKDEFILLKKAILNFDNAIKNDSSLIEAYYIVGEQYASIFSLNEFPKAIKYFDRVEKAIDSSRSNVCDTISNREILSNIALYYNSQEENVEINSLKAIQLYKKASTESLPEYIPSFSNIESDRIYYNISYTYKKLADFIFNSTNDYYKAEQYFDSALEFANKMKDVYDWFIKDIKTDEKVSYQLYMHDEWKPFRIICENLFKQTNIIEDCKPLVSNDVLYLYHSKSLAKEKNNIVRVWIKEVNLKTTYERESSEYDYIKSLFEFDLKNKKFKILQQLTQYSLDLITTDNYPNAEWEYITPESIAESMVENLKIITK